MKRFRSGNIEFNKKRIQKDNNMGEINGCSDSLKVVAEIEKDIVIKVHPICSS